MNTSFDQNNCGSCGSVCADTCEYGNCIVTLVSGQTGITTIVLDATDVYWTTTPASAGDTVMKMPKAGGTPVTLASNQSAPGGLAVDTTSVYWTSGGQTTDSVSIIRAGLDGSNPTTLATGQNTANIAVDANNVYWTENVGTGGSAIGSVFAVPKSGGNPVQIGSGQGSALKLTVAGSNVYWADILLASNGGNILSTPADGGTASLVAAFSHLPNGGVTADSTSVYWANEDGTLLKAPLGGGAVSTLATGLNQPQGVAVDGTSLYCAVSGDNGSNGSVIRVPLSGGTPVPLSGGGSPWAIAVDAIDIYWADGTRGSVRKLAK